jgi:hypothetical protein
LRRDLALRLTLCFMPGLIMFRIPPPCLSVMCSVRSWIR